MVNQYTIPASLQDAVSAVLSWLKGPKAGPFAQVCLTQVAQETYNWTQMVSNIEGLFHTTNKKDWARKELQELRQGKTPTDNFIVKWKALYLQADIENSYAVDLLERNTVPDIIARIFQERKWQDDPLQYLKEIRRVSSARESLNFIMSITQYRDSFKSSKSKNLNAMDISAAQHGNGRSCFNCSSTGHHAKDCRKAKVECPAVTS